MSSPFIGEIKMFSGNFAVRGYAFCNGQIMQIRQNTALFALLGVNFGGDGKTTFGLPDLQGRAPLHRGQAPGLSAYSLGEAGGAATVALSLNQLPVHTHAPNANATAGSTDTPAPGGIWSAVGRGRTPPYTNAGANVSMNPSAIGTTGTGDTPAHNNLSPHLALNFLIALQGIFPSRS
ncbi:MAG TPA: tail fiber protein [Opitutaceae bacterium]|nr:tail fiber protein [Opitutaceae bacterium]